MDKYKVLAELRYAARKWNAGEEVEMPPERAKKHLDAGLIEPIKSETSKTKKGAE